MEDETGQFQFQGQMEGAPSATYYLLMMQGKEFAAIPAGSWYVRPNVYKSSCQYEYNGFCFTFFKGDC